MLDDLTIVRALRGEVSVADVCAGARIDVSEFQRARDAFLRRRLPPAELRLPGAVSALVDILRDGRGIPHIYARTTTDLFFGLGFAMAQDRLWQMDLFRRRGLGTLAAVLGPSSLSSDRAHRILGLDRIAAREVGQLDEQTAAVVGAFVDGVNAWIEAGDDYLAIEFAILDYRPDPWSTRDVIAALRGFWWSLNGRLANLAAGEAARFLPAGPLRDAYLTPNLPDERILPPGSPYPPPGLASVVLEDTLHAGSDDGATGSNNWAVGRERTRRGAAVLGSDPHQPFATPANWYECRLLGPEDDVAGAAWAGAPGIWFGRNRQIAWGLTNNNVSLRDLYLEEVDPAAPALYRDGPIWRPFVERAVEIAVRGQAPEALVVRETVRGPIVNELVPPVRQGGDPPLSLRWVGQDHADDLRALLAVGRAQDFDAFRAALREWALPTFNWGYADGAGNVGYQCASRVPLRGRSTRGYRDANDPRDHWQGHLPFEAQPSAFNPAHGFISSANNAPVPDDYPYPYVGPYAAGERAIRIREVLESRVGFDRDACAALQNDTLSVQARQLRPALVRRLAGETDPDVQMLGRLLTDWDDRFETTTSAPTVYEAFLTAWKARVAAERFPSHLASLVVGQGNAWARLLEDDHLPWFHTDKQEAIRECARQAIAELRSRFGADPANWAWGKVHQASFRHLLANPASADAFDIGPHGVPGSASTVRNTGLGADPPFGADSGAEYRLVVDLADSTHFWATLNIGQSGQPGSPHYRDQFLDWVRGDYHVVQLERAAVETEQTAVVRLEPLSRGR